MASEEPTLEVAEPTLEEAEPPLSGAEVRLLRLLLTRAARVQRCSAYTVDFDQPPRPVHVILDPLLGQEDTLIRPECNGLHSPLLRKRSGP